MHRFTAHMAMTPERRELKKNGVVDAFTRRRRKRGSGAYLDIALSSRGEIEAAPLYQEAFDPLGVRYMMGPSLPFPGGEVTTCIAFERPDQENYSERGRKLLALVVPAYVAGSKTHLRMKEGENPFTLLECVSLPLIIFDLRGSEKYRNKALQRLLESEPWAERLMNCAKAVAEGFTKQPAALPTPYKLLVTPVARYELIATPFDRHVDGQGVLVQLSRLRLELPHVERVRSFYRLSPRQAEVALLLAEGLTENELATTLDISVNTARRHTERVLKGLGVKTRASVALKLLREL